MDVALIGEKMPGLAEIARRGQGGGKMFNGGFGLAAFEGLASQRQVRAHPLAEGSDLAAAALINAFFEKHGIPIRRRGQVSGQNDLRNRGPDRFFKLVRPRKPVSLGPQFWAARILNQFKTGQRGGFGCCFHQRQLTFKHIHASGFSSRR